MTTRHALRPSRQFIHAKGKALESDTQRWLEQEKFRRTEVARRLAAQRRPLDGFSVIRLPSLNDDLDEVQPPMTRHAGGEA